MITLYLNDGDGDLIINLLPKPFNAHTCLMYAARIRGAVFQEHCVVPIVPICRIVIINY